MIYVIPPFGRHKSDMNKKKILSRFLLNGFHAPTVFVEVMFIFWHQQARNHSRYLSVTAFKAGISL
jgi:hypothetical protein